MPEWYFITVLGLFGLLFGSFANVVIWRLPRGESIAHPGSHCPACDAPIAWFDNIPIVSWALLRGRCRRCGAMISMRYPLVEAASGIIFVVAGLRFGVGAQAVFASALLWGLLVLALIDVAHFRLPNPLVAALATIGVVGAVAAQVTGAAVVPLVGTAATGLLSQPLVAALIGALAVGGVAFAVAEIYAVVRKRQGLGMGDVKLLFVLGIFLVLFGYMALALASMAGTLYVLVAPRKPGETLSDTRIPFGAFLALGAAVTALFGSSLWVWYLRVVGLA